MGGVRQLGGGGGGWEWRSPDAGSVVRTKMVRGGNSRGVRIPEPRLGQAGLEGEVLLRVVESSIIIEGATPRAGWGLAAELLRERGEDPLLDEIVATDFDESDWKW